MGYRLWLSTREETFAWCGGKYYGYEDVRDKPSYEYLKSLFKDETPMFLQTYCWAELSLTPAEAENFIRLYIDDLIKDCIEDGGTTQEIDDLCTMKLDAIRILRNTHDPVLLEWS